MWLIGGLVITIFAIIALFTSKTYSTCIIVLLGVALYNIPLKMLGNSASAGIFPVDLVSFFALLRYFVFGKRKILRGLRFPEVYIFILAVLYVLIRSFVVINWVDYGYYNRFVLYGAFRWMFFLLLFAFFIQNMKIEEQWDVFLKAGYLLIGYFLFAIAHQQGFVDLSGLSATGQERSYDIEYLSKDIYRSLIGNNAASVGFISSFGLLLSLLLYNKTRKRLSCLLFLFSMISLFGSGSRSDIIATTSSLLVCVIFFNKTSICKALKNNIKAMFLVMPFIVLFVLIFRGHIGLYGIERFINTDFIGEALGNSEGTFAYRIANWKLAMNYWKEHINIFILGFGPNGYRMFSLSGVGTMGYGHNVYIHTVGEIGVIGFLLLFLWLKSITQKNGFKNAVGKILYEKVAIISFLVVFQRLIAGISVDSLFAVDNMLCMNVFLLFIIGVSTSFKHETVSIEKNNQKRVD